ncbi:MAG: right-handed parallel beta-helix repeat-containing protein [Cyclobacteriaceae bacterium]
MIIPPPFILCKRVILILVFLVVLSCSEEQWLLETTTVNAGNTLNTSMVGSTEIVDCSACTYVVSAGQSYINGLTLGLLPGSVIGLDANVSYGGLLFANIVGTHENPIIIRNCGGTARVNGTGKFFAMRAINSKHFRITGGNVPRSYGINISGATMGLALDNLSTNFELDHIEIQNSGFAGIMAKTDPSCDDATIRGNFIMKKVDIHNNYIHDTGGEGIYAGNSFYMGMNTNCGVRLPHEIHYIRIYDNIIKNTGWEAIQLGCATKGASIHANTIENYGLANKLYQNNGIQIGAGTGGVCHNNLIKSGTGNGLIVMGLGDNIIYNNVIDNAGEFGIFCDERGDNPGSGFKFLNNTILNPKLDGIRIYAELVAMNVIVNNIIINPGSYLSYTDPRTPEDAFVYKLSGDVKIDMANNYFATNNDSLKMNSNYKVDVISSPIIDKGADISAYYSFKTDFYYKPRLRGAAFDIGAVEQY